MSRYVHLVALLLCANAALGAVAAAPNDASSGSLSEASSADQAPSVAWLTDYGKACQAAQEQSKMLLIYFWDDQKAEACQKMETHALVDPNIVARLADWICLKLPVDATITSGGRPVRLLEHPAFGEMLRQPGFAILDYAHREAPYYGLVVSTFPMFEGRAYSPREVAAILDLPPGTLTQRTLIYAVRTHPDHPASTTGRLDPHLLSEAESHSRLQALIRLQGHHNWDSRFQHINARLPFGLLASEVCAESWPGQGLLQAAIECVHCWRLSSGHWSAVCAQQQVYAYDMKRGNNGIWYATGIFGRR